MCRIQLSLSMAWKKKHILTINNLFILVVWPIHTLHMRGPNSAGKKYRNRKTGWEMNILSCALRDCRDKAKYKSISIINLCPAFGLPVCTKHNKRFILLLKEPKHECAIFLIGGHFLFLAVEQLQSVRLFQPLFLFLYTGRQQTENILNEDSKWPRCTLAVNQYGTITWLADNSLITNHYGDFLLGQFALWTYWSCLTHTH